MYCNNTWYAFLRLFQVSVSMWDEEETLTVCEQCQIRTQHALWQWLCMCTRNSTWRAQSQCSVWSLLPPFRTSADSWDTSHSMYMAVYMGHVCKYSYIYGCCFPACSTKHHFLNLFSRHYWQHTVWLSACPQKNLVNCFLFSLSMSALLNSFQSCSEWWQALYTPVSST